ncbi:MAG TPA: Zn-ribbon domain-containing OB-fold protein [Dehalococcoidia bacterium]|nr:Zn-ribbon domain-containing OB-fold protein [Dehalococcoidia bacterium]
MTYAKPLPEPDVWSRPFWEAAQQHELRMQRCAGCGHLRFPPGPTCTRCLSPEASWELLSGRGRIWSWTVFHQLYYAGFKDELPYNVALVELEEGPRLYTNIVGIENDALREGLAVEVTFEQATDEITIPRFRPAASA